MGKYKKEARAAKQELRYQYVRGILFHLFFYFIYFYLFIFHLQHVRGSLFPFILNLCTSPLTRVIRQVASISVGLFCAYDRSLLPYDRPL